MKECNRVFDAHGLASGPHAMCLRLLLSLEVRMAMITNRVIGHWTSPKTHEMIGFESSAARST